MQIYLLTNLVNGKYYVGKTVHSNLHWYLSEKRSLARHGQDRGMPIIRAMIKYGSANFVAEVLATATSSAELDTLERLWIAALDARNRTVGYNVARGGEGGHGAMSEVTKQKISKANKGRKLGATYVRTSEHGEQIRQRMVGNQVAVGHGRPRGAHSPEEIAKRSVAIQAWWDRRKSAAA